ncbi:hypothetical protein Ddye_005264 [Dipteronia dyeriana]|uniref:Coatomer beta subunit C-terminal domain-containing protein n=1 Tax=Dipteronia dyeriana TaxID=168575 RepID=A0AAD9XGG6_9ROSI|nr:hypothetical protein Ddye_005264 [Dipteronia dyeriana]
MNFTKEHHLEGNDVIAKVEAMKKAIMLMLNVHHYDIVLDVTVISRTKETLQNLCLELATVGDLKLVECPQNYTLAPESSKQINKGEHQGFHN